MTPADRWSPGAVNQATSDPAVAVSGRATALRALHRPGAPLVLPNIWDAGSARLVEAAGFPAVATSSAAVAESLGYADGEGTPAGEMLDAVSRIVHTVSVPVTADLERGYGMWPADLVERLAATGAAGCNLEDSDPRTGNLVDPAEQADFLAAVRAACADAGVDLVINARVDVYLAGRATPGQPRDAAVDRARRYLAAGADCVYPIAVDDRDALRDLVRQIGGPVNALCLPGWTPAELAELGVARVSFGSGLYRCMQTHLENQLKGVDDELSAGEVRGSRR